MNAYCQIFLSLLGKLPLRAPNLGMSSVRGARGLPSSHKFRDEELRTRFDVAASMPHPWQRLRRIGGRTRREKKSGPATGHHPDAASILAHVEPSLMGTRGPRDPAARRRGEIPLPLFKATYELSTDGIAIWAQIEAATRGIDPISRSSLALRRNRMGDDITTSEARKECMACPKRVASCQVHDHGCHPAWFAVHVMVELVVGVVVVRPSRLKHELVSPIWVRRNAGQVGDSLVDPPQHVRAHDPGVVNAQIRHISIHLMPVASSELYKLRDLVGSEEAGQLVCKTVCV
mmetsp:Transcript_37387/g.91077  ORF Transcript_37387/g.91077 Transcript_37387/m.91077 type:complete len:289 (-) Transcript_37387:1523-2389(-)